MNKPSSVDPRLQKDISNDLNRIAQEVIDRVGKVYPKGLLESWEEVYKCQSYLQREIDKAMLFHFGNTIHVDARVILSEGPGGVPLMTLDTVITIPNGDDN